MMETTLSKLAGLGFSEYEAKAYIALLKESPSSPYEIAKNSGIPTSKIYEVIKRLESRNMVQAIHGERVRMFVPLSPDEFIERFKTAIEDKLNSVRNELSTLKTGIETSYTWHIKDYENLILKAKRMLDTSQKTVLLSIWPAELGVLEQSLGSADGRGVKISTVYFGAAGIETGQVYRHPVEDTIFAQKGVRGLTVVIDSREVLVGNIKDGRTEAVWSMNESLVLMAEDYIRHDIYAMKIIGRFAPLLKEKFGLRYEKLRDVFKDEDIQR